MNINENLRNKRKMVEKKMGVSATKVPIIIMSAANYPRLPYCVPNIS